MSRYSDEWIAAALEMHFGNGFSWEYIALKLKISQKRLKNVIDFAKRHGMKSVRCDDLAWKCYMQRQRLKRAAK